MTKARTTLDRTTQKRQATAQTTLCATDELHAADPVENGKSLYAHHCAACHGERGNGQGIAAAYFIPNPEISVLGVFV